jgi:hypothetical protein
MDMRENNPHRASIKSTLNKPIATLMRHPNKGRYPRQKSNVAKVTHLFKREPAMLHINKQGIKTGILGRYHHLSICRDFDPECFTDLVCAGPDMKSIWARVVHGYHSDEKKKKGNLQ